MKKLLFIFLIVTLSGCLRLDSNLYNLSSDITSYKRDQYAGEQDFILGPAYTVPDSLIHEFTLNSKIIGEANATTIYATYIGSLARIKTDTVIVYCHGNKWHMDFYWQRAKLLANVGAKNRYGVLMIDYRGYGLSEGTPSEEGLYADVNAGLEWLKNKGLSDSRLVMYGFSLGSAPATELTANPRSLTPAKIILEAPFASAEVMANDGAVLAMPASFVTNLKIDNAEEIKKVKQPFLWLHGANDNFLNIKTHGEVIFKNYQGYYKEAHRIPNTDHGQIPAKMGFAEYCKVVETFIKR